MNKKILIIGQAPPLKTQQVPYDTTLLYTMLEWVGVSKEQAQDIFEFEALTDQFPGKTKAGSHKVPSTQDRLDYWQQGLRGKTLRADKVICLGKEAEGFLLFMQGCDEAIQQRQFLYLPHPSRRNYSRIMKQREEITEALSVFLQ